MRRWCVLQVQSSDMHRTYFNNKKEEIGICTCSASNGISFKLQYMGSKGVARGVFRQFRK